MTRLDKLEAFRATVSEMRAAQRAYFRTRKTDALELSKKLERTVDEMLRRLDAEPPPSPQGDLFGGAA